MDAKILYRKKALESRDSLNPKEVQQKSEVIGKKLIKLPLYESAKTILFYASFNNEVKTDEMIVDSLNKKKSVCLPLILEDEQKLCIKKIDDIGKLSLSCYGIREPDKFLPEIETNCLDVIIVPGVCFDKNGNRIGFGGGYYDKLLSNCKDSHKIALAYDFQIVEDLPVEDHDEKVDIIVTETQTIFANSEQ